MLLKKAAGKDRSFIQPGRAVVITQRLEIA
jgi:hypothetical protein